MSHNPEKEIQAIIADSQRYGFNICVNMVRMFRDALIGKATEEQLTPLNATICQLEQAEKEIFDVNKS
ncbi:MAG: hypothetical protein J6S67_22170 [Methanobrevibacter sp.]|nr:hypothetical protein [Methanobrevibacter sp.]